MGKLLQYRVPSTLRFFVEMYAFASEVKTKLTASSFTEDCTASEKYAENVALDWNRTSDQRIKDTASSHRPVGYMTT